MTGKIFSVFIILTLALSAYDQTVENGGFAGEYMYTMGSDARTLALGGAGVAIKNTASGIYYNPASIGGMVNKEAIFLYAPLLFNVSYSFIALAYPVVDGSVIGISRSALDLGGIEKTDASGLLNGSSNLNEACYSLAYGAKVLDNFSVGGSVRIVTSSIDIYSGTGYGFDLGAVYSPLDFITAGVSIQNLLAPQITLNTEADKYPTNIRIGASFEVFPGNVFVYTDALLLNVLPATGQYSGDYRLPLLWFAGVEVFPVPNIAVRGGINYKEFTAGFGYKTNDFDFDYGASFHSLGMTHRVSIALRFGLLLSESEKWLKEKEKEVNFKFYYSRALKFYNEKRYKESRTELNEVLALSPEDKDANELLYRIEGGEKISLSCGLFEQGIELFESGKEAEAREKINEAKKYDPEVSARSEKEYMGKAEEYNKDRKYDEAKRLIARVLFIDPENAQAKELFTKLQSILELLK